VDLGMPDWREAVVGQPMTPQDIADVVAWLASYRQRLPGRTSGLGQGSK
jgi:NADP-dependent 3-hydroxy acid dehydrogenase YdfG